MSNSALERPAWSPAARYRHTLWLLTRRDLRVRYSTSALGYVWSILDPLVMSGIYWFVFTQVFQRPAGTGPYIVFLLSALLPWMWFNSAVGDSTRAFLNAAIPGWEAALTGGDCPHEYAVKDGGVLLYLRQEGRGIGLINKLRAYQLQDQGFDTVDANQRLGLPSEARDFPVAARMLDLLGIGAIRLMTNNPAKVAALEAEGVAVAERVPHQLPPNPHNARYLDTKRDRTGHAL